MVSTVPEAFIMSAVVFVALAWICGLVSLDSKSRLWPRAAVGSLAITVALALAAIWAQVL